MTRERIKYIICLIIFLVIYTLRFIIGIKGIPGPYFGYRNGADHLIWEGGFSSTGDILLDGGQNILDDMEKMNNANYKTSQDNIKKLREDWYK